MPWEQIKALLWYLISIVLLVGAAYWVTKFGIGGKGLPGSKNMPVRIKPITQINVGRSERLLVVQAGGRYFFLGVTTGGISVLAEFTPEEMEHWNDEMKDAAEKKMPHFSDTLNALIKKKNGE